jgi:uncharacterized Tic20 family protein
MDMVTEQPADQPPTKEENTWAMVCHLSAFAGHLFPFGHIIAPLIVWILKKDQSAFVDDQGKEALNCQIAFTIYAAIALALCFLLIGFLLLPVVWLADVILVIVAAIKANEGVRYRYPFIFRLVS